MNKVALGSFAEAISPKYVLFMDDLNKFSSERGLRQFNNWSKNWEYPWLSFNLGYLQPGSHILDIGSELSPIPWRLAERHIVEMVELNSVARDVEGVWMKNWLENDNISWEFLDSEYLPFDDETFDVVTSLSVIEHQPNKELAISEASRVLRPGGILAMSFDICEPYMGMEYPSFNGSALTMQEFDRMIWSRPEWGNETGPNWNTQDIPDFLEWHKQSAPHHKYVCGAAILKKA
jgi:SAM-dependent methyltransferase